MSSVSSTMQGTSYLFLLNRFQDLDYALLVAVNIYTFKNFTVFSSSNFSNNLIVILITAIMNMTDTSEDNTM